MIRRSTQILPIPTSRLCALACLFLHALSTSAFSQDQPPRPNIILIMCDDLGWGDTGFNGNQDIQTPNLDRLAARGIVLNRFYSAGAVCSPTRASCITGRNPNRMDIPTANSGHMKPQEHTLPELLRTAGYRNGHFGKWHLGTLTASIHDANRGRPRDYRHYALPTEHGYDTYFCSESKVPTWDPLVKPSVFDTAEGENLRFGWAALEGKDPARRAEFYGTFYWSGPEQPELHNTNGDDSRVVMDRVVPFIREAVAAQRPFFTTVWFHTPHLPVVVDSAHRASYTRFSHRQQLYYGTITAMDEQVGRLWQELERLGISQNTMIWFCSDNGPEQRTPGSSGPFRERKRSLYEGGVRVPAFVVWPTQIPKGQTSNFPMVTSDYLPTILDYLQLPYPDTGRPLDGISLRAAIESKRTERNRPIGFLFREKRSWVAQQYKLISTDDGATYELYDLLKDPGETKNIIDQESEAAQRMKEELLEWLTSVEASRSEKDY